MPKEFISAFSIPLPTESGRELATNLCLSSEEDTNITQYFH